MRAPGVLRRRGVLLDLPRVEGQRHGGHEEAGLAVEVVVDEGGVHPRLAGDRPQAGAVVALGGEDAVAASMISPRVSALPGRRPTAALTACAPAAVSASTRTPTRIGGSAGIHQRGILCYNSSVMNHTAIRR